MTKVIFFYFADENDMEVTCCNFPPEFRHKNCMPIDVPPDDPFYSKHGVRCLDFLRTMAGHRPGCALGKRYPISSPQLLKFT